MIFQDPHHGFRDPVSWKPSGDSEWTTWDYALVSALQLIEDYSTDYGVPVWEAESERVVIEAVRKSDKFEAARDRATSRKKYKKWHGERWVPRVSLRGGDWPTFEEWVKEQADKEPQITDLDEGERVVQ